MKHVSHVTKIQFLPYWPTPIAVSLGRWIAMGYDLTVNWINSSHQTIRFILNLQLILICKAVSIGTVCSPNRVPQIQIPIDRSINYSLPASRGFLPRVL